jgi:hypothetical protein
VAGDLSRTGFYLWQLPAGGGANPEKLIARLNGANIARIYVKIADGTRRYPTKGANHTEDVVAEAKAHGLAVWGWHYVYGESPEAEADIAAEQTAKLNLAGYIYNAEKEYRDHKRVAQAKVFTKRLRDRLPSTPFGFSSFKYPKNHAGLPWAELGGAADVLMPQVYWVEAHNPDKQYDKAFAQWSALNPAATMVPTGAAYTDDAEKWRPSALEIAKFLKHVHAKGCAAADFWVWDYLAKKKNADLLDAIRTFEWAPAGATTVSAADLTPDEHVPAESEIATCGKIAKVIKRNDAEFATLVKNDNADIVFKDEEATAADRMMTAKLKAKLDALAVLVKAEWSGVKLRVTEAWDENGEHAAGSLHYEGRAADLTTAPKDAARLGRLGRLAVDAGCDWVLYETDHIHVSMKK